MNNCKSKTCGKKQQTGGAASDFRHGSLALHLTPDVITKLTLAEIDKAPMFNPLEYNTRVPMGYITTGIVPEGIYYMNKAANKHCQVVEGCANNRPMKSGRENLIDELKRAMNVN